MLYIVYNIYEITYYILYVIDYRLYPPTLWGHRCVRTKCIKEGVTAGFLAVRTTSLVGIVPESVGIVPESVGIEPESVGIEPEPVGIEPESVAIDPDTAFHRPHRRPENPKNIPKRPQSNKTLPRFYFFIHFLRVEGLFFNVF